MMMCVCVCVNKRIIGPLVLKQSLHGKVWLILLKIMSNVRYIAKKKLPDSNILLVSDDGQCRSIQATPTYCRQQAKK